MTAREWSEDRIRHVHDVMAAHVTRGAAPGLVTLLAREEDVRVDAIGTAAVGGDAPMRRDTLFRISSMTKPITAAAAMILVDEGKLHLDEPVDRLLPELANRKVLRRFDGPLDDTVPARRAITVRDLLTFRMGFGILWGEPDRYPIQRAAIDAQLGAFGPPHPRTPPPPDEWMRRFATLPLMFQPGEVWLYNTSFEVLGVLIARAAGKPLDVFMRERIFEPLGMKDTSFHVPDGKLDRLATSYMVSESGALDLYDGIDTSEWRNPPAFPSGGAGLISTIDDSFAFARMMLHPDARAPRILSESAVEAMTRDQITAEQKAASGLSLAPGFWDHRGWGLGVTLLTRGESGAVKRYGWDGGLGTSWYSYPKSNGVAILLTQCSAYPDYWDVYRDFRRAADDMLEG